MNADLSKIPARELEMEMVKRAIVRGNKKIQKHEAELSVMKKKQDARLKELARQLTPEVVTAVVNNIVEALQKGVIAAMEGKKP